MRANLAPHRPGGRSGKIALRVSLAGGLSTSDYQLIVIYSALRFKATLPHEYRRTKARGDTPGGELYLRAGSDWAVRAIVIDRCAIK